MKFVTKEEFDKALTVIVTALNMRQVTRNIHGQEPVDITSVCFESVFQDKFEVNEVTFVSEFMAVQKQLHVTRQQLKATRELTNKNKQEIESLESLEKVLVDVFTKLKE